MAKSLLFDQEGRRKLSKGIDKIAKAVGSTLGPSGQTVLIESPQHTHGITVTKDGVTVAKAITLGDPVENLAVRMMKEAADRTATLAGDGTTTSIVLTEAIVSAGLERISNESKTEVLRRLVSHTRGIVSNLRKASKAVTKGKLRDVATISANNDSDIGNIISKVYKDVGRDGIVTVDRSKTSDTYYETTHGLKVDRGWRSPLFINDHKRDECIYEDAFVMVCDAEITSVLQIENVLKPIIAEGKKLLIIAECSNNVLNTIAANVMKNGVKVCIIAPPNFGYRQHELMQDIALSVGATYFSEKTGDDLSLMTFNDLGRAEKVIVGRDDTIIIKDPATNAEAVAERVEQLRVAHSEADRKDDRDFILSRIASLTGGIGVIYAGGNTDLEQKELYDRIDDAVCAVRSALEEGILPGGGTALLRESFALDGVDTASEILRDALRAPFVKIMENAGLERDLVKQIGILESEDYAVGVNAKTNEMGDMYKMGVIDPVKVTRSALENAVSVAVTILSTNAIVYEGDEPQQSNINIA